MRRLFVSGVGGVGLLAEVLPVSLRLFDAVVLSSGLDVGEGLFALVVGDVLHLIEAGDGVAHMGGIVQRLLALVGEGVDGFGKVVALLCVEGLRGAPRLLSSCLQSCVYPALCAVALREIGCCSLAKCCE